MAPLKRLGIKATRYFEAMKGASSGRFQAISLLRYGCTALIPVSPSRSKIGGGFAGRMRSAATLSAADRWRAGDHSFSPVYS